MPIYLYSIKLHLVSLSQESNYINNINAIDLNALLEKAGDPSDEEYASIRLRHIIMEMDGDTEHFLIVKKKRDCLLFIKKIKFTHPIDEDLDSAETDAFYIESEKALSLYDLLLKEIEKTSNFYDDDAECYEGTFIFTKDGDEEWSNLSDAMFTTPTIMAIFKELITIAQEENGSDYGAMDVYDTLSSSCYAWLVD